MPCGQKAQVHDRLNGGVEQEGIGPDEEDMDVALGARMQESCWLDIALLEMGIGSGLAGRLV